ncbi:MAG: MBL fold metallo-hydrolase [Acutalibacter sp.]|nr:MBL fold metallo-hydrolase [Acutalibacter sp.]
MEYRSANITERGFMYGKWMTAPNTWTITFGGGVYSYLIIGEEKALLFDTAYGMGNLREFVEGITQKPVIVVNSHGHFDHTGGNPWWEEVYAGPGAEATMKKAFSPEMQEDFNKKPFPDYQVHTVREGHVFDLGGRQLEVIEIPAHHESSIALLDRSNRALYSGDELEAGQVLLFVRNELLPLKEVVTNHMANMNKLKAHWDEFDIIYPAHNGPGLHKSYIDDYIALAQHVLAGDAQIMPDLAGFGWAPSVEGSQFASLGALERAQYGGASFIYVKE